MSTKKKKRTRKKILKKKGKNKTRVTFGLESHVPKVIERKRKELEKLEKGDIIIAEIPDSYIKSLEKAEKPKQIERVAQNLAVETGFPEYSAELFKLYKEMMNQGKKVKGITGNPETMKDQFKFNLTHLKRDASRATLNISSDAKFYAEANEFKENKRTQEIKEIIKKNPGKNIYVDTGAAHTPEYHELKKLSKKNKNLEVKTKHLTRKDLHEAGYPKRIREAYDPYETLERHFRFNTKTAQRYNKLKEAERKSKNIINPERKKKPREYFANEEEYQKAKQAEKEIKRLEDSFRGYEKRRKQLKKELIEKGLTPEKADYEAILKTMAELQIMKKPLQEKNILQKIKEKLLKIKHK